MYRYHRQPDWAKPDCAELQEFAQWEREIEAGEVTEDEAKGRLEEIIELMGN